MHFTTEHLGLKTCNEKKLILNAVRHQQCLLSTLRNTINEYSKMRIIFTYKW
jgi:hypothetical protein